MKELILLLWLVIVVCHTCACTSPKLRFETPFKSAGLYGSPLQTSFTMVRALQLVNETSVFIVDEHRILEWYLDVQNISLIAGKSYSGYEGDNGDARDALFNFPTGICVTTSFIYIIDTGNLAIRRVSRSTGIVSTVLNNLVKPSKCDSYGNEIVYIDNNALYKYSENTNTSSLIAGTPGSTSSAGDGAAATSASFISMHAVRYSKNGLTIYVSDEACIRGITNGIISVYSGKCGYSGKALTPVSNGKAGSKSYTLILDFLFDFNAEALFVFDNNIRMTCVSIATATFSSTTIIPFEKTAAYDYCEKQVDFVDNPDFFIPIDIMFPSPFFATNASVFVYFNPCHVFYQVENQLVDLPDLSGQSYPLSKYAGMYIEDVTMNYTVITSEIRAVSVVDDFIYFIDYQHNRLMKVNVKTKEKTTIYTGLNDFTFTPTGEILFKVNLDGSDYGIKKIGLDGNVTQLYTQTIYAPDESLHYISECQDGRIITTDSCRFFVHTPDNQNIVIGGSTSSSCDTVNNYFPTVNYTAKSSAVFFYSPTNAICVGNDIYLGDSKGIYRYNQSGMITKLVETVSSYDFKLGSYGDELIIADVMGLKLLSIYKYNILTSQISIIAGTGNTKVYPKLEGSDALIQPFEPKHLFVNSKDDTIYFSERDSIHKLIPYCESPYILVGRTCTFSCSLVSPLSASVCHGRGNCIGMNTCNCTNSYSGVDCEMYSCFNQTQNASSVCSGKGNCIDTDHCNCTADSFGSNCELFKCYDVLNNNQSVCSGNGNCISTDRCECNEGWTGSNCEQMMCFEILSTNSSVCSGHGNCISNNTCLCNNGWLSQNCSETLCDSISSFNPSVCYRNGDCTSYNNCTCNGNWFGAFCNITKCFGINSDDMGVCSSKGDCVSIDSCECHGGYFGLNCSVTTCFDIFSNETGVCNGNGQCIDSNSCDCNFGWLSSTCNVTSCYGVESNNASVCFSNGNCVSYNNCTCFNGYFGLNCSELITNSINTNNSIEINSTLNNSTQFTNLTSNSTIDLNSTNFNNSSGNETTVTNSSSIINSTLENNSTLNSTNSFNNSDISNGNNSTNNNYTNLNDLNNSTNLNSSINNSNVTINNNSITIVNSTDNSTMNNVTVNGSNSTMDNSTNISNLNSSVNTTITNSTLINNSSDVNSTLVNNSTLLNSTLTSNTTLNETNVISDNSTVLSNNSSLNQTNNTSNSNSTNSSNQSNTTTIYFSCFGEDSNSTNVCSGNGICISQNTCQCLGETTGDVCNKCKEGYFGLKCKTRFISPAVFGKAGNTIEFSLFTKEIYSNNSVDCNKLLSTSSLALFGASSSCYWRDRTSGSFVIEFSQVDSSVFINSSFININVNVFDISSLVELKQVDIDVSTYPFKPIAKVSYQKVYSTCEEVSLDAIGSFSGDFKPLRFYWKVETSPMLTSDNFILFQNDVNSILKLNTTTSGYYLLSLIVESTTSGLKSDKFMIEFQLSNVPKPSISILNSKDTIQQIQVNSVPVILKKGILVPSCYFSNQEMTYSWSQLSGPSLKYYIDNTSSDLVITSFGSSSGSNEYIFSVTAISKYNSNSNATTTVLVSTISQPLYLNVFKTELSTSKVSIGVDYNDPDSTVEYENFIWKCLDGCNSVNNFTQYSTMKQTSLELLKGNSNNMTIVLSIVKGNRMVDCSLNVEFPKDVSSIPPMISLISVSPNRYKVVKEEILSINLFVLLDGMDSLNEQNIIREWSLNGVSISPEMSSLMSVSPSLSNSLVIPLSSFTEGTVNSIKCKVTDRRNSLSAEYVYPFKVVKSPRSCVCSISPLRGYAFETSFSFSCPNCQNVEQTIDFVFGFIDDKCGAKIPLYSLGEKFATYFPMSYYDTFSTFIDIVDTATGAYVNLIYPIKIDLPLAKTVTEVKKKVKNWQTYATGLSATDSAKLVFNSATITRTSELMTSKTSRRIISDCNHGVWNETRERCDCFNGYKSALCNILENDYIDIMEIRTSLVDNMVYSMENRNLNEYLHVNHFEMYIYGLEGVTSNVISSQDVPFKKVFNLFTNVISKSTQNQNLVVPKGIDYLAKLLFEHLSRMIVYDKIQGEYGVALLSIFKDFNSVMKRKQVAGEKDLTIVTKFANCTSTVFYKNQASEKTLITSDNIGLRVFNLDSKISSRTSLTASIFSISDILGLGNGLQSIQSSTIIYSANNRTTEKDYRKLASNIVMCEKTFNSDLVFSFNFVNFSSTWQTFSETQQNTTITKTISSKFHCVAVVNNSLSINGNCSLIKGEDFNFYCSCFDKAVNAIVIIENVHETIRQISVTVPSLSNIQQQNIPNSNLIALIVLLIIPILIILALFIVILYKVKKMKKQPPPPTDDKELEVSTLNIY